MRQALDAARAQPLTVQARDEAADLVFAYAIGVADLPRGEFGGIALQVAVIGRTGARGQAALLLQVGQEASAGNAPPTRRKKILFATSSTMSFRLCG